MRTEIEHHCVALGVDDTELAARAVKAARGKRLTTKNLVKRKRAKRQLKKLRRLLSFIDLLDEIF